MYSYSVYLQNDCVHTEEYKQYLLHVLSMLIVSKFCEFMQPLSTCYIDRLLADPHPNSHRLNFIHEKFTFAFNNMTY